MGYTEREFGDYLILYTKDLVNAMPIGNATVGPQPCLNSSQISRPEDWPPLFMLEDTKCTQLARRKDQRRVTRLPYFAQVRPCVLETADSKH